MQLKRGFTLIELIFVIAIFSSVLTITIVFFTSIISQANKINISTEVKQNGQLSLEIISRHIRNAIVAVNPDDDGDGVVENNKLDLTGFAGEIVRFECILETADANGYITLSKAGSFAQSITNNDDPEDGISLTNCQFDVIEGSINAPKIVNINLTFHQAVKAPSRVDFSANASFVQTISLRNLTID